MFDSADEDDFFNTTAVPTTASSSRNSGGSNRKTSAERSTTTTTVNPLMPTEEGRKEDETTAPSASRHQGGGHHQLKEEPRRASSGERDVGSNSTTKVATTAAAAAASSRAAKPVASATAQQVQSEQKNNNNNNQGVKPLQHQHKDPFDEFDEEEAKKNNSRAFYPPSSSSFASSAARTVPTGVAATIAASASSAPAPTLHEQEHHHQQQQQQQQQHQSATSSAPTQSASMGQRVGSGNTGTNSSESFVDLGRASPNQQPRNYHPVDISFATFRLNHATMGNEALKPITYFPITIKPDIPAIWPPPTSPSGTSAPPNVPPGATFNTPHYLFHNFFISPLHHRLNTAGQRRSRWELTETVVERRYSELSDFREFLCLSYPMLVIPPLPTKGQLDSFQTYMQSEGLLKYQQRCIGRFVRELAKIPEVMLMNDYVPPFFQLPREKFGIYFGKVRELVKVMKKANASIEDHMPGKITKLVHPAAVHGGLGRTSGGDDDEDNSEGATGLAKVADTSGKAMKSVVTAVSGWFKKTSHAINSPTSLSAPFDVALTSEAEARARNLLHSSPDWRMWQQRRQLIHDVRFLLKQAGERYLQTLLSADAVHETLTQLSQDFENYAVKDLGTCEHFMPIIDDCRQESNFVATRLCAPLERELDKKYIQVYEQFLFSVSQIEALDDAIRFVMCLLQRRAELIVERGGATLGHQDAQLAASPTAASAQAQFEVFATNTSRYLSEVEYPKFEKQHSAKLLKLAMAEVKLSLDALTTAENVAASAFAGLFRDDFMEFPELPPLGRH